MIRSLPVALFFVLFLALCLVGCGGTNNPAKNGGKPDEHAHEHSHEGPHGGHLIELAEPMKENKEEYHIEWNHEESGKVTVWLLDGEGKKEVPTTADNVLIDVTVGGKSETFELLPLDRTTGEKAAAFKFEVTDKGLLGKLETVGVGDVAAKVRVDVNGKAYEGTFEKHEEHDHAGHKH